jgi:hypothetical protein
MLPAAAAPRSADCTGNVADRVADAAGNDVVAAAVVVGVVVLNALLLGMARIGW